MQVHIYDYYSSRCLTGPISPKDEDDIILKVLSKNEDETFDLVKEYIFPVDEQPVIRESKLLLTLDPIENRENIYLQGALSNSEKGIFSAFHSFNILPDKSHPYFSTHFTVDAYHLLHEQQHKEAQLNLESKFALVDLYYSNALKEFLNEDIEPLTANATIVSKPENSNLEDYDIKIVHENRGFSFFITPDAVGEYNIDYACGIESNLKSYNITVNSSKD